MTENAGTEGFTDAEWAVWEPLIEAVRPQGKTPPKELRRTIAAIFWRHQNGAKWRAIPTELGPWWLAAQLFIRWAKQGVWEHLLELAQEHAGGLELGLAFLDGTNIRAHAKAAGAPKKGELARAETSVKRLVALAAGSAPKP
jgi:transposase